MFHKERVIVSMYSTVKKVKVEMDLGQSIGKQALKISDLSYHICLPKRDKYYVTIIQKSLNLICHGNLAGRLTMNSLILDGEHQIQTSSSSTKVLMCI
jgi:hypothetical protein